MIALFDQENIDQLNWPLTEEGQRSKKFILPLIKEGTHFFIANAKTKMCALQVDDHVLPITISSFTQENCHSCSPTTLYGGFSLEQIERIKNPFFRALLRPPTKLWNHLLRKSKIDKIIYVNNWLLSTNLHPQLSLKQVTDIRNFLSMRFKRHALAFRSITTKDQPELFESLVQCGFKLIPSRPVFFVDATQDDHFKSRMFKSDLKMLANTDYEITEEVEEKDIARIVELYRALYIEKYTALSPQLNYHYFESAIREKWMHWRFFKKNGRIDAVLGFFSQNGVMTAPIFGYDTTLPQELGLYRMVSTVMSLEAKKERALLNMSAGATSFKTLRRAEKKIEFNAVYTCHLNSLRRFPWNFLDQLLNRIGAKVMTRIDI